MFLNDLWLGFLYALVLVAPITAVTLVGAKVKSIETTIVVAVGLLILYTLINWLWFWWGQPIIGFSSIAINHQYWLTFWAIIFTGGVLGFAAGAEAEMPTIGSFVLIVAVLCMLGYGISQQAIWTTGNAKTLAHEAQVVMQPANSYPDDNPNNIRQVSEHAADFYASQVLQSKPQWATTLQVGNGVLQSVNDHLYYIYPLYPTSFSNSTKFQKGMPGYAVVDAQDPSNRWLQTKDAYGHPIHMAYYEGGYHVHGIGRYLWAHGYRDQIVEDVTLEVNDKWQPYYTAAVMKPTVNFTHDVPSKAMLINPTNGKITLYPIKNGYAVGLPNWVDRIYSTNDVTRMLNWWGEWNKAGYGLFNETSNNRYKVVGTPTLVYADSGHPVWQVELTSWSTDKGAEYLALFDGRDDHVRVYQIPLLTQASQAANVIEQSQSNLKKLTVVNLTLYKIYGTLTWVGSLVCNQDGGYQACAQQGMAMLPYNRLDGEGVAFSSSLQGALTQYEQILSSQQTSGNVQQNGLYSTVTGVVSHSSEVDQNGNTVWYFFLTGDSKDEYTASLQSSSTQASATLPFLATGETVTFRYLNTGSTLRQVATSAPFDIQGLGSSSS